MQMTESVRYIDAADSLSAGQMTDAKISQTQIPQSDSQPDAQEPGSSPTNMKLSQVRAASAFQPRTGFPAIVSPYRCVASGPKNGQ